MCLGNGPGRGREGHRPGLAVTPSLAIFLETAEEDTSVKPLDLYVQIHRECPFRHSERRKCCRRLILAALNNVNGRRSSNHPNRHPAKIPAPQRDNSTDSEGSPKLCQRQPK